MGGANNPYIKGGGYIFSGEVDVGCVGPMFVAMIVFCWCLDLFFSTVEEKVEYSPANTIMVHKVYKELMILGFIQFAFILSKDFGITQPTKSTTHCFDWSLLMVTFTVFLYVCNTLVSSFGMHVSKRSWDRMAMKTADEVVKDLEDNLPPDHPTCGQSFCMKLDGFIKNTLGIGKHWRVEADFKTVELLFKTKFYLDRTFDYNRYLAFVLEDVVVNLSNLSPYHWLIVMLLCVTAEKTLDEAEVKVERMRMMAEEAELAAAGQLGMDEGYGMDDGSGIRRRLAGTAEESESDCAFGVVSELPVVTMPCGMDEATIHNTTTQLFVTDFADIMVDGLQLNLTNTTSFYGAFCRKCEIEQQLQQQKPLTLNEIQGFILGGWLLLVIEVILLHFLRHRQKRIYHFHGAGRPSNIPVLLKKLDRHFSRNQQNKMRRGVDGRLVAEETITIDQNDNDNDDDDDDDDIGAPLIARAPVPANQIDPTTTPESTRNLEQFLDSDITNSPAEKQKEQVRKKKERQELARMERDDDERKGEEMEMMYFANAGKDADDILSYRLYVILCSITKMVMLLSCLYVSFYWLHYSIRVSQHLMHKNYKEYGEAEQELVPWGEPDSSADRCNLIAECFYTLIFYHFCSLLPMFILVFSVMPKVTRRISLLVGVLHLHEDALEVTVSHMETITNVRDRIRRRLEFTTVVKGKPNLKKGQQLLDRLRTGEVVLLHKLTEIDKQHHENVIQISHKKSDEHRELWSGVDWNHPPTAAETAVRKIQSTYTRYKFFRDLHAHTLLTGSSAKRIGRSRVTRKKAMALLDEQDTHTETDELVEFLSREAFEKWQEMSEDKKETALTAKSLRLSSTDPDDDSFLVSEFGTFLVRAIATVANIAAECGVPWEDIKTFEDEVVNFGSITRKEFVTARRMARSKALFYSMSHNAHSVSYKQLWKGLKRYRVPISKSELNVITPVIDPDQSGELSLEEWLDFALGSDDGLIMSVLYSAEVQRKANAAKGSQQGGLVGMAIDSVQYSREAIMAMPMGALMLSTLEHPIETGKKAVEGVQTLAEMEANDALAVMAGVDKQRKQIMHDFQPKVGGAFVDVAKLGLHAVEEGVGAVKEGVGAVAEVVEHGVDAVASGVRDVEDFVLRTPEKPPGDGRPMGCRKLPDQIEPLATSS